MIQLDSLVCGYHGNTLLAPIDLHSRPGSITSLIGPNGSGKSTLLKTIAGLLPPVSGSVAINGRQLSSITNLERARLVAFGNQRNALPPITVFQLALHGRYPHQTFPRKTSSQDISIAESALEQLGILTLRDRQLSHISGGETQKAYLAMLVCQQAKVLILDEPGTYLDMAHQKELMEMLSCLAKQGSTIFLSTHDIPSALAYSDHICLLGSKQLAFFGTADDLLASNQLERCFGLNLQTKQMDGRQWFSIQ